MKKHTKSSITLPPSELAAVNSLMKKLKAKSKVEVIRRALALLRSTTERAELREQYRVASTLTREESMNVLGEIEGSDWDRLEPFSDSSTYEPKKLKTRDSK